MKLFLLAGGIFVGLTVIDMWLTWGLLDGLICLGLGSLTGACILLLAKGLGGLGRSGIE